MNEQNEKRMGGRVEPLQEALKSRAEDDHICCETALATAAEFGVAPSVVGKLLNRMEIKIARCQLGCF